MKRVSPQPDATFGEIGEQVRGRRRMRRYLAAFVAGVTFSIALFCGSLAALLAVDRLPPPPVSGTWCIDSRFAWLRQEHPLKEAVLIAVGSSTTWRNLDLDIVPSELKSEGVVNAAPCFLTINQTRYLAEYYLQRAPGTKTLLTVLTPRDFEGCSRNPTAFFDPGVADPYIGGQGSPWWLYFRNFRLRDVVLHAYYAKERRLEMRYDRYGSGPLTRAVADTGRTFKPEPSCYAELTQLAKFLDSKGVQLVATTFPVMPAWAELHDPVGTTQASFRSSIQAALNPTRAILIDGMTDWRVPDAAFTDPVHLQWPETAAFTRFIWNEARQRGATLPPLEEDANEKLTNPHHDKTSPLKSGSLPATIGPADFGGATVGATYVSSMSERGSQAAEIRPDAPSGKQIALTAPMADAITQNTAGCSEGYPVGVPRHYAWRRGLYRPLESNVPPPDFTAVTGWGQIYPKWGSPPYAKPDGRIAIANAKTYVHLSTGSEWILVQDQAKQELAGAHYVADFKPEPTLAMKSVVESDGTVLIGTPPAGYNDHFWITRRGTYPAGSIDGVYVQMDIRTNDPDMKFVANVGADWWRNETAEYVDGFANNPGAGMSNWVELSMEWSTLRFFSWNTARLVQDPPPPLSATKPGSSLRRAASARPHCQSGSARSDR